jgi:CRISPR system Cascade subunit CasA
VGLVGAHDLGTLAELRRPPAPERPVRNVSHFLAGNWAPDEVSQPVFEYTAFLFARYHAGMDSADRGSASMGKALRRLREPGSESGPGRDGVTRLFTRIATSRAVPQRALQNAIDRLRSQVARPPAWSQLARDLRSWDTPGYRIQHAWARDFYAS